MAARKRPPAKTVRAAGSWMALLAATTLGADTAAERVRAEVRVDSKLPKDDASPYRLIVQSYDAPVGADGEQAFASAKPVGSTQRRVTADELRRGVQIDLLELRAGANAARPSAPVVVAWVEGGDANLEHDGRRARPQPGAVYGTTRRQGDALVQITLDRKA